MEGVLKYVSAIVTSAVVGAGLFFIRGFLRDRKLRKEEQEAKDDIERQIKERHSIVGARNAADDLGRVREDRD